MNHIFTEIVNCSQRTKNDEMKTNWTVCVSLTFSNPQTTDALLLDFLSVHAVCLFFFSPTLDSSFTMNNSILCVTNIIKANYSCLANANIKQHHFRNVALFVRLHSSLAQLLYHSSSLSLSHSFFSDLVSLPLARYEVELCVGTPQQLFISINNECSVDFSTLCGSIISTFWPSFCFGFRFHFYVC